MASLDSASPAGRVGALTQEKIDVLNKQSITFKNGFQSAGSSRGRKISPLNTADKIGLCLLVGSVVLLAAALVTGAIYSHGQVTNRYLGSLPNPTHSPITVHVFSRVLVHNPAFKTAAIALLASSAGAAFAGIVTIGLSPSHKPKHSPDQEQKEMQIP